MPVFSLSQKKEDGGKKEGETEGRLLHTLLLCAASALLSNYLSVSLSLAYPQTDALGV